MVEWMEISNVIYKNYFLNNLIALSTFITILITRSKQIKLRLTIAISTVMGSPPVKRTREDIFFF